MSISKPKMMLRAAAYGAYGGDRIGVLRHATKISLTTSISLLQQLCLPLGQRPHPSCVSIQSLSPGAELIRTPLASS